MKQSFLNKFISGLLPTKVEPKAVDVQREVSFIHTHPHGERTVRMVKGKLINDFLIDYSKPLGEIKEELEQLIDFWMATNSKDVIEQLGKFPKSGEVAVHEGSNHIDVILCGKGSLGWLTVADHFASKLKSK